MKNQIIFIISLIILILSILLIVNNSIGITNDETITKKVDCYDEFENKIIGLICEEESWKYEKEMVYSAFGIVIGFFSFLVMIASILQIVEDSK